MLETVKNAFKVKEIRSKLLYTLMMLVIVRLGCELPVPGVDRTYFASWFAQQTNDAYSFLDTFTGGSFLNMSVFALNITPYITSSIIMQLLTIAIPKLEEMSREGEDGRKKIASITRYVTVGLALRCRQTGTVREIQCDQRNYGSCCSYSRFSIPYVDR